MMDMPFIPPPENIIEDKEYLEYQKKQEEERKQEFERKKSRELQRLILTIPRRLQGADVGSIEKRITDKLVTWVKNDNDWCLFLQGTVGTGKSFTAYATFKLFYNHNSRITTFAHFSSMDLVSYLQEDYRNENSKNFDRLCKCDLLLIDDLATERSTEDATFQVSRLIYHREAEIKKTIITTNEKIDDLAKKFHPRLTSRIMSGTPIVFKGNDRRIKKDDAK